MYRYLPISDVYARKILDSNGNPTIEVEVLAGDEFCGRASVPSGTSISYAENEKYLLEEEAVEDVNTRVAPELIGMNIYDQVAVDRLLSIIRGVAPKQEMHIHASLAVSMAVARAAAESLFLPLYSYLGGTGARQMPEILEYPTWKPAEADSACEPMREIFYIYSEETVSELLDRIREAKRKRKEVVLSISEGETEDVFLADLAVAVNADKIILGKMERLEYVVKRNRLDRIREWIEK